MPFMTIFRYEEGMKIEEDRKAKDVNEKEMEEVFNQLGAEDLQAFKYLYEHEISSTKMVALYLKDKVIDYSFSNRLKDYQSYNLLDSYYILSEEKERSVNMYTLSKKAAIFIKNRFQLENDLTSFYDSIENNNPLYILKRMALNQFLIGSKDVKDYKMYSNKRVDAYIEYNEDPKSYYVKVARFTKNEVESILEALKYINEEEGEKRTLIVVCEDTEHLVSICKTINPIAGKKDILYQTDIMALKYPEFFQTVDFEGAYYTVSEIKKV